MRMRNWITPAALFLLSGVLVSCEQAELVGPEATRTSTSNRCEAVFDQRETTSQVVLDLDPAHGEFPEGIAVDHRGRVYLGLRFPGTVLRFRPGEESEVVAQLTAEDGDGNRLQDQGLLGLATDRRGNVYAAVASFDPTTGGLADTHGVWRISPAGDRDLVPGTDQIFFPNALTFDRRGNLYVSSSTGPPVGPGTYEDGGIWRVPPGGTAELWLRDGELTGTGELGNPFPIGANGIAHHGGALFVANTEKRQVVEVPIRPEGNPGATRVAATFEGPTAVNPFAGFLDGLAVDACGHLYPLLIGESRLVRVSPDGQEVETVADAEDGLQTPTSLAFGTGEEATSVFIAEFAALADRLGQTPEPKVVQVDVGVPGPEGR